MRAARVGIVAGVALLVVGVSAAVWVGPDDWIDSPMQVINGGGEVGAVTTYGFLSHTLPLRVTASVDDGDVFVGVGHVVDVDDYVADARLARMEWFSPSGVQAAPASTGGRLPVAPSDLDIWQQRANGPGEQRISGEFAGQPVVAFVAAVDGGPRVLHVCVGSQVRGAFVTGLTVAGIGAALVLAAIAITRRNSPDDEIILPADEHHQSGSTPTPFIAGLVAIALVAAGCTTDPATWRPPQVVPLPGRDTVRRDPLAGLNLEVLAGDYDRRNNAAIAASSSPQYSATRWEQADADLVLGRDRYVTAWNRETRNKDQAQTCHTALDAAFPVTAAPSYPLAVVTTRSMRCNGKPPTDKSLAVYTRQHAVSPWRLAAEVNVAPGDLPEPGADEPTTSDAARLLTAADDLATYLSTGRAGTLSVPSSLAKERAHRVTRTSWTTGSWLAWLTPDAVQVAQAATGPVAVVSLHTRWHLSSRASQTIGWKSRPFARILHQTGWRESLDAQLGVTAALRLNGQQVDVIAWQLTSYVD